MAEQLKESDPYRDTKPTLYDEIQKGVFTNWINHRLREEDRCVDDLETDLHDGIILSNLLEALSGKKLHGIKQNPTQNSQKLANLEIAFKFITETEKIKLIGIGPINVHERKLMLILGLVWTLIRHYQLAAHRHHHSDTDMEDKEDKKKKEEVNFESLVLRWVQVTLPQCNITNFTTNWNDGRNLSALVNYCKPGLIPEHATLDPSNGVHNISVAMNLAWEHFGIPKIMKPEDLASEKPDKRSVALYLSHFCCPDPSGNDSIGQKVLLEWIQQQIPGQNITNFTTDWTDGQSLGALTNAVSGGKFPNYKEMGPTSDTVDNCCQSMDAAERLLGIKKTIEGVKKIPPHEAFAKPHMNQLQRMIYLTPFCYASVKPLEAEVAVAVKVNQLQSGVNLGSRESPGVNSGGESPACLVFYPSKQRVNTTCKAMVDASRVLGRSGDIAVTAINGPSIVEKCQVTERESESGKYDIEFVPHEVGTYVVTIEFEDFSAPKKFTLAVNDPSKVTVFPTDLCQGQYRIGQTVIFTVSTKLAGEGKTAVVVHGPVGNKHLVLQDEGEGTYRASFTPSVAGSHNIKITFDGEAVPCSPLHLMVGTGVFPDRVVVTQPVPGKLGKYMVQQFYDYKVNAAKAGEASLNVTGYGIRSGAKPGIKVVDEGNGQYTVCVSASEPDDYHMSIMWGDEHVPGSPFHLSITGVFPDRVVVTQPVPGKLGKYVVQQSYDYKVNAAEAGEASLNVTGYGVHSGAKPDIKVVDEGNGQYTVCVSASEPDDYHMSIMWGDEHVPGSPFHLSITGVFPDKVVVTQPKLGKYMVQQSYDYKVNAAEAGEASLNVTGYGIHSGAKPDIKVVDEGNGQYTVCVNASEPDDYHMSIMWGDEHVPGSPFHLSITGVFPDKVVVTQPKLGKYVVQQSYDYKVNAAEAGEASLNVTGYGVHSGAKPDIKVVDEGNGQYTVCVNASEPDDYHMSIMWGDEHVPGSPFHLSIIGVFPDRVVVTQPVPGKLGKYVVQQSYDYKVNAAEAGEASLNVTGYGVHSGAKPDIKVVDEGNGQYTVCVNASEPDDYHMSIMWGDKHVPGSPFHLSITGVFPDKVVVTQPKLGKYVVQQSYDYKVNAAEAGEASLNVTGYGVRSGAKPDIKVVDEGNGQYTVCVTASEPDDYHVSIMWGDEHVPGSPFHLLIEDRPRPDQVVCSGPHYVIGSTQPVTLDVYAEQGGAGELSTICCGNNQDLPVEIKEGPPKRYTVSFTPPAIGVYSLSVLWSEEAVKNSPFTIDLHNPPDASKCIVTGPEIPPEMDAPVTLQVDACAAGHGKLTASAIGEVVGLTPVSVEEVKPCVFIATLSSPTPDKYNLLVNWGEQPVPGSPFFLNLLPPNAKAVTIAKPPDPSIIAGQPICICFDVSNAGRGILTSTCSGMDVGEIKETSVTRNPDGKFLYDVEFVPPDIDLYTLEVFWSGKHVKQSPFTINLAPPDITKVKVIGPTYSLSGPVELMLQTQGAGKGRVTGSCYNSSGDKILVSIVETSHGCYQLSFQPPKPDVYMFSAQFGGEDVKGSPFYINTIPPDAGKVVVKVTGVCEISKQFSYQCDVTHAGSGKLTATCWGESCGPVPVTVEEKSPNKVEQKSRTTVKEKSPTLYIVSLTPLHPDIYFITVKWAGEEVPNSPFIINLLPPDAQMVKVGEFHYPPMIGTDEAAWVDLDCSKTGPAEPRGECRGNVVGEVPVEIEKLDSYQTYRVKFQPKKADTYHFCVFYGSGEVPGSPFEATINPLPPDTQMVKVGEFHYPPTIGTGEVAWVDLDCSKTGPAEPRGECRGNVVGEVPVEIEKLDSYQTYRVKFQPKKADTYHFCVFYGSGEVPGSPFEATINPMDAEVIIHLPQRDPDLREPPKISIEELALWIGEILKIIVKTKQRGDLEVTAVGDKVGHVDIETEQDECGNFIITFNPAKPDRYTIEATLDKQPLPKSRIIVNYSLRTDASKCYIIGFKDTTDVLEVNKEVRFSVHVENAGDGTLSVTADGPSSGKKAANQLVVAQSPDNPMIYNVSYLPTACGQHRIHIQWGKEAIPMSPLVLQVGEKVDIPTYSTREPIRFVINANCRTHDLTAHAIHQGSDAQYNVRISEVKLATFSLTFTPIDPGVYCIHVFLKGKEIQGSPYKIRYSPRELNPRACVLHGLRDKDYTSWELIEFSVDTTEAGDGDLHIELMCPSADDSSEISVVDNKDGTYHITFIPRKTGTYQLKITFANELIRDDPILVRVLAKESPDYPPNLRTMMKGDGVINVVEIGRALCIRILGVVPEAFQCIGDKTGEAALAMLKETTGSRLVRFVPAIEDDYKLTVRCNGIDNCFLIRAVRCGSLSPRYVIPKGAKGLLEAKTPINLIVKCDDDDISVTADGPHGPCEVSITDQLEGSLGIGFIPGHPGDYYVHVKKHGSEVGDSPYRLSIRKKDINIHLEIKESSFVFTSGCFAHFIVSTTEASPGNLNISMKGPGKAEIKVFDKKDGTYSCEFIPSVPGKYTINVMWNDEHIPGSPFTLNFKPENSKAIVGLCLENEAFYINSPFLFKLDCSELGEGDLKIKCKPESAATVSATRIQGTKFYQCEIEPREIGNHQIKVLYQPVKMKAKQILGSPFNVVFRHRGDASKCEVIDTPVGQVHELGSCVTFSVSAKEAGRGKLTAFAESSSAGAKLSVPVAIAEVEEHKYSVEFCPVEGTEYLLSILYDEKHIPGSPFKVTFSDSKQILTETDTQLLHASLQSLTMSQPIAENVKAYGSGLRGGYVGQEGNFIINTGKAGSGVLDVKVKGPKGAYKVKMRYQPENKRIIFVRYDPTVAGTYTIEITWSGVQIPDSPFTVTFANQQ